MAQMHVTYQCVCAASSALISSSGLIQEDKLNLKCKMTPLITAFFPFFFPSSNLFTCSANTYWFFVPICAPFLGAVVGVLMYQLMIGYHLESDAQDQQKKEEEEERFKLSSIATNDDA